MRSPNMFRTRRLVGRAPSEADGEAYGIVFGRAVGTRELQRNLQDYARHLVAPWTLQLDGVDVGVGGFRIGFGQAEGLELVLSLRPGLDPVGLAGEFLADSLLFAQGTLRADRVFSLVDKDTTLSDGMLSRAGFVDGGLRDRPGRTPARIMEWRAGTAQPA